MLGVLVRGEAGAVRRDLEEHPARLPEVDGAEIKAVYPRRYPQPGGPDPLPPHRMLLVVRRPESDVVHPASPQMRRRRVRPLDDPYLRPGTPSPDLEKHHPFTVLNVFVRPPETQHLREHPRRRLQVPHRELEHAEAPDAEVLRYQAALPGNAARHTRTTVVHEPEPLPLGVGEGEERPPTTLLHTRVRHPELREPACPPVERLAPGDPQLRRRDLAHPRVVRRDPQVGPVEERDLRPRPP